MRLYTNFLLLLAVLLISTDASAGKGKSKRRGSSSKAAVVVVTNFKADSTNRKVQRKLAELSVKVREVVADTTTNCTVVSTGRMRSIQRKYKRKIASCYDDCDVEFGLLAGANFVVSGNLAPTANSVVATMEIRDTRTRNVIAVKRVEGANYLELESAVLRSVRRFVMPLNSAVYQAVDDEVIKDEPPEDEEAEDAPYGAQSGPPGAGSEYLVPGEEPKAQKPLTPLGLKWQEAKEETPLFQNEAGVGKAAAGIFGLGINIGYPFNVARAKQLTSLYTPVLHAGIQLSARVHRMLEISILADFNYLSGKNAANNRFGDPGLANCIYPDDYDEQNVRKCSSTVEQTIFDYDYDNPTRNFYRSNLYGGGSFVNVGVRPNIRLIFPVSDMVEVFVGAGLGINYTKTSGWWQTMAGGNQFLYPGTSTETAPVTETAVYNVSVSSVGLYGAFEAAVVFRLLNKRLGVGPFAEYRLPAMWQSGVDAEVTISESFYTILPGRDDDEQAFLAPTTEDIKNSPFGHTEVLNLLTVGLTADWRF